MKRKVILLCLVMILAAVMLVGCGEITYEVIFAKGEDAIRLENAHDNLGEGCTVGEITFASLADMKQKIEGGMLSETELGVIYRHFIKNEDGSYPIFDLESLQTPRMPQGLSLADGVRWYGQHYEMSISGEGTVYGSFCALPRAGFEEARRREIDTSGWWNITTEYDAERDADAVTYFTDAGKFRQLRYTLTVEDTTLYVIEQYTLSRSAGSLIDESDVSETLPTKVSVFGKREDAYFCFHLDGFSEAPERSWLSCFSTGIFEEN